MMLILFDVEVLAMFIALIELCAEVRLAHIAAIVTFDMLQ
jgi:hypothetical protein